MPEPVTVTCPECGAKLKLKSRASLGQTRPCPKCGVPFVLGEESGADSYDVDLDARGVEAKRSAKQPVLKRGVSRGGEQSRSRKGPVPDLENKPLAVGLSVGALVGVGMLLAWLIIPRGNGLAPAPQPDHVTDTAPETPVDCVDSTPPNGTAPRAATATGQPDMSPPGPGRVASQGVIDLLANADPQGHSLGGRWERRGAELHSIGSAKLKVPVEIDSDYRVRMMFTREGDQQIMLALTAAGRRFVVVVNSKGNDVHGLSSVDGRGAQDNQNPTHKALVTNAGQEYLLETDVRTSGNNVSVRSQLNGNLLFDWTGPGSQLDNGYWQIPTPIGIGSESRDENAVVRYEELSFFRLGPASAGNPVIASNPPPATPDLRPPVVPSGNTPPVTPVNPPSAAGVELSAADTIGFRNPGQGVYSDSGVPTQWDANRNIAWKTPMPGAGSSSPIVIGDRIYLTAYSGYAQTAENPGDISGLTFHVLAIDRSNGQIVWNTPGKPRKRANDFVGFMQQHGYASSTLATDGERLFAQFNNSGGFAFDLNGQLLWQIDLGPATHGFGSGASPVVHDDVVIFNASVESKALIAVNRVTGREAWRTTKELGDSYTTPVIVPVGGQHELIVSSRAGLTAFDASNGELLWEYHAGDYTEDYACVTPVVHNGIVYGTQNRRSQLSAVRLGGRGDVSQSHRVWHDDSRYDATVASPVLFDGHLFWPKDGQFAMFNAASGEIVSHGRGEWRRLYASPIVANGNLYVVSRYSGTYVARATRDLEPVSHNVIEGDDSQFNASPVVHQGQLLLRSDRFLYCIGERRVAAADPGTRPVTAALVGTGANPGTNRPPVPNSLPPLWPYVEESDPRHRAERCLSIQVTQNGKT